MVQAVTVGRDIAKNVFHAYGVDAQGEKAFSRKLRRAKVEAFFAKLEPCLIGIEACATAHHWATNFDKSDITGTEAFRKELNARHGGRARK